ncbi:MAG TPA: SDR family oxidoreductase [Polyangiaceae bacterium]|jgi:3-oxoacyl-[acyl-carrier protein] reductase|nr:SDR family oxidoreductase [Polyangiaceae bacterium]
MTRPVAIVTGAASGIGKRMALSLHRAGYRVVAVDLDAAGLERLSAEHGWATERDVVSRVLDVRDVAGWDAIVALAVERFGRLDALLNVAGFLRPGYVHETEPSSFDLHLDINVKGVMYGTRAAARQMIRQGHGHIVNVASIAGLSHTPGLSAYCASKHAVRGFTLSVAHELVHHGVAVSVFCPDAVETPMLTLQEAHPEAAMTFGARRALTLDEVERALHRVLAERPLELVLDVPLSGRALGARLGNLFPKLISVAVDRIVQQGLSVQKRRLGDVSPVRD